MLVLYASPLPLQIPDNMQGINYRYSCFQQKDELLLLLFVSYNYTLLINTFRFHITLVVEDFDCFMLDNFVNIVQLTVVPFLSGFPDCRSFTTLFLTGQHLSDIGHCYFKGDSKFLLALCA